MLLSRKHGVLAGTSAFGWRNLQNMNEKPKLEDAIRHHARDLKTNLFCLRFNEPEIYSLVFLPGDRVCDDIQCFLDEIKKLITAANRDALCDALLSKVDAERFAPVTNDDKRVLSLIVIPKFFESEIKDDIFLAYIGNFLFEFGKKD